MSNDIGRTFRNVWRRWSGTYELPFCNKPCFIYNLEEFPDYPDDDLLEVSLTLNGNPATVVIDAGIASLITSDLVEKVNFNEVEPSDRALFIDNFFSEFLSGIEANHQIEVDVTKIQSKNSTSAADEGLPGILQIDETELPFCIINASDGFWNTCLDLALMNPEIDQDIQCNMSLGRMAIPHEKLHEISPGDSIVMPEVLYPPRTGEFVISDGDTYSFTMEGDQIALGEPDEDEPMEDEDFALLTMFFNGQSFKLSELVKLQMGSLLPAGGVDTSHVEMVHDGQVFATGKCKDVDGKLAIEIFEIMQG